MCNEEQVQDENALVDELKDNGYKSYQEYIFQKSYERASREYERKLNCPYD